MVEISGNASMRGRVEGRFSYRVLAWGIAMRQTRGIVLPLLGMKEGRGDANNPAPTKTKNRYGIELRGYPKIRTNDSLEQNRVFNNNISKFLVKIESGVGFLFGKWCQRIDSRLLRVRMDPSRTLSRGKTITELKGGGKGTFVRPSVLRPFVFFFFFGVDIPPLYHCWTAFCWTPTISARAPPSGDENLLTSFSLSLFSTCRVD